MSQVACIVLLFVVLQEINRLCFMFKIGCHLSISNGFLAMGKDAISINANTFQFFTRNPRGGAAKAIDKNDIAAFLELAKQNNFASVLAHAPYTLNLCAASEGIRNFARETMADDMRKHKNLSEMKAAIYAKYGTPEVYITSPFSSIARNISELTSGEQTSSSFAPVTLLPVLVTA